ncbi:MAG TPA: FG-GAP-like repeat-containing protein, partial [Candidatus Dormibacteraeota bacterium]|nr:FG-GAP-like repeat-containing protein [Candidatus Dormibacteraeota bacterium]
PANGNYFLFVHYNYDYYGEYRLRVSLAHPPLQMESENNNNIAQANRPNLMLTNGQETATVTGYIGVGDGSGDYYWVRNRAAGTKITLDLSQPINSGLVGQLWIYNAAGTLMTNSPAGVTNLVYDVLAGSDYYARVTAASNSANLLAQYILSITVTDAVPPVVTGLSVGNTYVSQVVTQGSVLGLMADRFSLSFSEDMLAASVNNVSNYDLRSAGANGVFGDADDEIYPVLSPGYSTGPGVTYLLASGPLQPGSYRLTVNNLQDRAGNAMAAPFVLEFAVNGVSGFVQEGRTNGSAPSATSLSSAPGSGPNGTLLVWGAYGVQNNPYFVASGFFNADSNMDLVTANYGNSSVSVLLSDGAEGFSLATNISVGGNPVSVAVGDLNGDGYNDVVVANYGGAINVLLGNGSGGFVNTTNYGGLSSPYSVVIGDFNGDNRADVAVANYGNHTVSVLLGDGSGAFPLRTNYAVGVNPWGLATGDVNGDGRLDLVTANSGSSNVTVLLGNGDGTFSGRTELTVGSNPRGVAVGDLNGDGVMDLVVLKGDNTVSVLLGAGGGNFSVPVNYPTGGSDPYHFLLADLNLDGRPDVIVANYGSQQVGVLLGNGDGSFQSGSNYGNVGRAISVAVGDWNRDGRPDIAAARYDSSSVYLLFGNRNEFLAEDPVGSGLRSGFGRGNLANRSDYDYWSFSAQANDVLTVAVDIPGNPDASQLYYWVGRPDGSYVTDFYANSYNGWGQSSPVSLPANGNYFLFVHYNYDYYGEYRLRVSLAHPPLQMESENNNNIAQA